MESDASMTRQDRAVLQYFGGKWTLAQWIINKMPPHKIYVEPYCGSAAVFFQKPVAEREVLNDLNSDIVNLFRVLRMTPNELIHALELTPYSREEYQLSYELTDDPVEKARRYIVRCYQGISGSNRGASGWRRQTKAFGYAELLNAWDNTTSLELAAKRLKRAMIEHTDALTVIKDFDTEETLYYIDPPYVLSSRRDKSKSYKHEMDDADHRALADVLRNTSGMVMLSGYESPLYRELYSDWVMYVNETKTVANTTAREILWLNPAAAAINTLPLFASLPKADAP